MKKVYEAPTAEKIAFRYRDQVVAASGDTNVDQGGDGNPTWGWDNNPGACTLRVAENLGISFCDIM